MQRPICVLLLSLSVLMGGSGHTRPNVFPQTCYFNGKPAACMVSAFGIKEDPANDIEIWWRDGGMTAVRYEFEGPPQVGQPVLIDGLAGRIYRVRSCASPGSAAYLCTQVTALKPPGTLVNYSFGD